MVPRRYKDRPGAQSGGEYRHAQSLSLMKLGSLTTRTSELHLLKVLHGQPSCRLLAQNAGTCQNQVVF